MIGGVLSIGSWRWPLAHLILPFCEVFSMDGIKHSSFLGFSAEGQSVDRVSTAEVRPGVKSDWPGLTKGSESFP